MTEETFKSESQGNMQDIYAGMRNKTHFNNALYQITTDCFEQEQELVIVEPQLVKCYI